MFSRSVMSNFCDPLGCSTLGSPVLHYLPEFAQTHVHGVDDAIQPSHLQSPPSLLPSIFPSFRVFSNESVLPIRWPKDWSFSFSTSPSNEYSGQISFTTDWFDLLAVQGKAWSPGERQVMAKGKAAHSSILAWRIPWSVQSMGSQRAGHN